VWFEEAQSAFDDPNARVFRDPGHSEEEDGFILIGLSSEARLLVVVHCYRESDSIIRIIFVRKATKKEVSRIEREGSGTLIGRARHRNAWTALAAAKIVDFPWKRTELSKSHEIPRVRGDHSDPQAGSAHCNQRIIRQSPLSNFLVIILGGQTGQ
jgi:uncharacterized DUF497 family protein